MSECLVTRVNRMNLPLFLTSNYDYNFVAIMALDVLKTLATFEIEDSLEEERVRCITRTRVGKPALGFYESLKNIFGSKINAVKALK